MRLSRPLALAGAATLIAGLGVAAVAEAPKVHVLRVALPDGRVQLVRYTGDTPPRIVLVRAPAAESPFAALDRMSAMMDMQAAQMMRQVSAMAARPASVTPGGNMQLAALANAPAGARYSYTTTTVVNGRVCTTNVQATSLGVGKQPQLLRRVSGDGCGSAAVARTTGPTLTALPAPPTPPAPPRVVPAPATPKVPAAPKVPADTI
jgi:hypothetical protein